MKAKIFRDKEHKEIDIVFYHGDLATLYLHKSTEPEFGDIIEHIELGLEFEELLSMETKEFNRRKEYLFTITLEIENEKV